MNCKASTLKEARFLYMRTQGYKKILDLMEGIKKAESDEESIEKYISDLKALKTSLKSGLVPANEETALELKSKLYAEGPVLWENAQIRLRMPNESDVCPYKELIGETEFFDDDLRDQTIEALSGGLLNTPLYAAIASADSDAFMGYCGIKDARTEVPELAVELLCRFRYKGYAYDALRAYMDCCKKIGKRKYEVQIDADNLPSQRLFEKLGAVLCGIRTYILSTDAQKIEFEETFKYLISPNMVSLAGKLGVPPERLLSHTLRYEIE